MTVESTPGIHLMPWPSVFRPLAAGLALVVCLAGAPRAAAQNTYTWTDGSANFSSSALQLNGSAVPVGGLSNVILANTSVGNYMLRVMPDPSFGNAQMTLRLGTSNGNVLVIPGRTVMVETPVADAAGVA